MEKMRINGGRDMAWMIFDTQNDAQIADGEIFANFVTARKAAGYEETPGGGIYGKKNGVTNKEAQATVRWSIPSQVKSSTKWTFQKPGEAGLLVSLTPSYTDQDSNPIINGIAVVPI